MSAASSKPSDLEAKLTGDEEDEDFDLDAVEDPELPSLDIDDEDEDGEDADEDEDEDEDEDDEEDARAVAAARAPRRKKPMGRPKKQRTITKTYEEIPSPEVRALYTQHSEIALSIKRQTPTGSWVQIRNGIRCPPSALFDLQEPVTALAGGGTFVYDVLSVQTKELIAPRWKEHYDGTPIATPQELTLAYNNETGKLEVFNRAGVGTTPHGGYGGSPSMMGPVGSVQSFLQGGGQQHQQHPQPQMPQFAPGPRTAFYEAALASGPQPQHQAGRLMPPPTGLVPQWMNSFPAETQWNHVFEERVRKLEANQGASSNGAQDASGLGRLWINHEIQQGGDLKAQNAALTQALSTIEQRTAERVETIRKELELTLASEREKRERAEREIEQTRADARYNELKASIDAQRNAKPAFDMTALVGLAGALAPVLTARSTSEAETRRSEQAAQSQLMIAMLGRKESTGLDTVVALAPIVAPLLLKLFESSGPQAQAELMGLEHEQRLMQMKMLADMLASLSPEPPPAWQPIVEHLIKAVGGSMLGRALPAPQQPRHLPAGQPQPQVLDAPQIDAGLGAVIARFAENDVEAASDVRSIYERLPASLGFHSLEWATILFNVHCRLDPHELADVFVAHLGNCSRFGNLPGPLVSVFDQPEESLRVVFAPLPIAAKDPEYTEAVITITAAAIREALEENDEGEDGAPARGPTITPAPTVMNGGVMANAS